jgi:hypothetical protein
LHEIIDLTEEGPKERDVGTKIENLDITQLDNVQDQIDADLGHRFLKAEGLVRSKNRLTQILVDDELELQKKTSSQAICDRNVTVTHESFATNSDDRPMIFEGRLVGFTRVIKYFRRLELGFSDAGCL